MKEIQPLGPPPQSQEPNIQPEAAVPSVVTPTTSLETTPTPPVVPAEPSPPPAQVAPPQPTAFVSQAAPEPAYQEPAAETLSRGFAPSPLFALLLSLVTVVTTILFFTVITALNTWVKLISLFILSCLVFLIALRAHSRDNQSSMVLVSVIISTVVLTGTVIIGSTYTYYYYKLHSLESSFHAD